MKILLRLLFSLQPYYRQLGALVVCMLAVTGASLVTPALIRSAIDDGLARGSAEVLFSTGLVIVVAGLVRALFNFGKRYLSEWLTNRTGYDLRNALYDKIQRLSFTFHDQTRTGQLMSRCTEDVSALARFVGQGGVDFLNVLLLLAGILFLLFQASVPLTLIGLGPLVALAAMTYYQGRVQSPLFLKIDQALGDLAATLQENLTGAQVVRAFAREAHEKDKFAQVNRKLYHARVKVVGNWGVFMPTSMLLIMLSTTLILWFGGRMVVEGSLTLGELVAFNAYLLLLAAPASQLGYAMNSAGEAVAAGWRVYEVLDLPERIRSPREAVHLPALSGRMVFDSVSFSYRARAPLEADREALQDISFEAQPNQVIALIGPTGSGKTSLVNLIPRFYDVTAGSIRVDSIDIRTVDLKSLRSQIGIVLQSTLLFSTTLRENIAYGRVDASEQEIVAAAKAARAHDFIMALPKGYDTVVGERGITLSGGQRQRVAIARALLMDPRILILDDSTSSVDMRTEYLIQQALAELMKGRTTFVIAQRLASVKRADLILVLENGRIVQRGTHDSLLAEGGLYKEVYDLQLKDQEQFRNEMLFLEAQPELEAAAPSDDGNGPGHAHEELNAEPETRTPPPPTREPIALGVRPEEDSIVGKAYDPHITRRLLTYLRPYRRPLLAALGSMTLATAAGISGPYLVKVALDGGVAGKNLALLQQAVALYLLSTVVMWLGTFARVRIMAVLGQSLIYDLRRELFDHLQALSLGFFSRYAVGRLISRVVNDVGVLRDMITWAVIAVVRDLFDLLGITLAMLLLNWQLSLLTFLVLPLMAGATEAFRRRARQSYREVRSAIGWVNAVLNENIVGVRVVQSFSREDYNRRLFAREVNGSHLRASNRASLLISVFYPSVDFLSSVALGLVVWLGGLAVLGRAGFAGDPMLTPGTLVAFALYIDRFFDPIRDLSQRYNTFQATMASSERIFELLDTPIEVRDVPEAGELPPVRGRIDFDHVSFHYADDPLPVLEDIDLHVTAGEMVALVGETGAGKSTLVKLISRFYDPVEGCIAVDGRDLREVTQDSLRRQMGVVLQDPFLFSGTVGDNIRYGCLDAPDEAVEAAARAVGAHGFIQSLDYGYNTLVGEGGAILSGGQRQLVSFARALLADPRILILDEATSSVDTQTERIIQTALERLFKGRTSFVIAHRLSTITRADRIIVLDQGRIVEEGTHAQLLAQRGRYFDLYTMAFAAKI